MSLSRRTNNSIPRLLSSSQWHPVRPIVASISQGVVTVWAQQQVENWSAFAPDFKELDENVDYEERESEFDLEDEDRSVKDEDEDGGGGKNSKKGAGADGEVNVCSVDPIPAFCSSDEEDEGGEEAEKDKDKGGESSSSLLYLPIAPEIEEPEDHWVPGVDDEGGSGGGAGEGPSDRGSKRDAAKENASPSKRKRTKTTEIALPNAPKDGKESNCLVNNTKRYNHFVFMAISRSPPNVRQEGQAGRRGQAADGATKGQRQGQGEMSEKGILHVKHAPISLLFSPALHCVQKIHCSVNHFQLFYERYLLAFYNISRSCIICH